MPMYDYKCGTCGAKAVPFLKIAQLDDPFPCPRCAQPMTRLISAPMIAPDYQGYDCPITGKRIEGRKAHLENLAEHGCRLLEPGERQEADRRKIAGEAALEASLDRTVEELVHTMPAEKRDALAADLEHFSADVVRTSVPL